MTHVGVFLDADANSPLKGVDPAKTIRIQEGIAFTRIPHGTQAGKSVVAITAPLPDGRHVFLEVTMWSFECVAGAMRGAEQRAQN